VITAGAASTATARKYIRNLPLLVIDRPSLTDCLWLQQQPVLFSAPQRLLLLLLPQQRLLLLD